MVPTWLTRVVVVVVVALLAVTAVTLVARLAAWQAGPLLFLVAATPYLLGVCVVAGVLALAARSRTLVVLAGVGLVTVVVLWAPAFIGSRDDPGPAALTVMTVNLQFGGADAAAVVAAVRESGVQVLSVQELTQPEESALRRAGLGEVLPYRYTVPLDRASGTGLWSQFPLSDRTPLSDTWLANLSASTHTSDGPVRVVALHAGAPLSVDHWRADMDAQRISDQLMSVPAPLLVAGDFNATRDNRFIRELERHGFTDSATAAGAGLIRTWPTDMSPMPPLVGIDHVMTRGFPPAVSVRTIAVDGTDHLALVVQLPAPQPGG